jgi:hypothetical protein
MIVPDTSENLKKCICTNCQTYKQYIKERAEGLFCARGTINTAIEEDDCLCGQCDVDEEYKLTIRLDLMEKMILKLNQFYCNRGPAGTRK